MLYERVAEYLELDTRTEVLNARFQVLQEMLDMLRDHKNNRYVGMSNFTDYIILQRAGLITCAVSWVTAVHTCMRAVAVICFKRGHRQP